jgi:hypothetical protein
MDKQMKGEIKGLMKQGFPEEIAIITACANAGKPEQAIEYLEELNDDQNDIKMALEMMGMLPLGENPPDLAILAPQKFYADEPRLNSIISSNIDSGIKISYEKIELLTTNITLRDISGN